MDNIVLELEQRLGISLKLIKARSSEYCRVYMLYDNLKTFYGLIRLHLVYTNTIDDLKFLFYYGNIILPTNLHSTNDQSKIYANIFNYKHNIEIEQSYMEQLSLAKPIDLLTKDILLDVIEKFRDGF